MYNTVILLPTMIFKCTIECCQLYNFGIPEKNNVNIIDYRIQ